MFEQRLTRTERLWRDLRWAVCPERCSVMTLRQRVRGALAWFLAGLLILLSVLLILQQTISRMPRPKEAPPDRLDSREWFQTVGLLWVTAGYIALLPWLGFLLVTPVYLIAAMRLSGARWRVSVGATAVAVTGVIYVSFVYFFKVSLPSLPLP